MADKPNIVLIFPDQLRGDTLGCVGHPVIQTPNLDRIAAEGVIFENCYTNSPLCMPARASLMNGRHVCEHGVWRNEMSADRHGPSHVRSIRDAGYHTALVGKTHLYAHGPAAGHTARHVHELRDWGFEDTLELTGPLASGRMDSPYTDYLAQKGLLERHRQFIRSYVQNMRSGRFRPWEEPPCPLPTEDHLDSYTGRMSAEWIRNYHGDKPFYLQVLFPGPHDPFDSPAEYRAIYRPEDMPVGTMEVPAEPVAPYVRGVLQYSVLDGMTERDKQVLRTFYYGKVTLVDHGIGEVLKALEERGFLDNTWIIVTSDHGEMAGDHYMLHKMCFYEEALKIPCIIRPPRGTAAWKASGLCDQIDIAATLLDVAEAKPFEGVFNMRSLLPQVKAGPQDPNAQSGKEVMFSEIWGFSMVHNGRYKMAIEARTRRPVELYDLANDPRELRNLVNEPSLEGVSQELLERHLSLLLNRLDIDRLEHYEKRAPAILSRSPWR